MIRAPSLRQLRRDHPANVAILPCAPARQVQQRFGRAYGIAKRELLASQAVAFPYEPPWAREEKRSAQSLELRAGVPAFDPGNPAHLRAWEAIWDLAMRPKQSDGE